MYTSITFYSFAIVGLLQERLMSGQDPGNFLAAIKLGLDVTKARPHVPGYPLFVLIWRALNSLGFSPEASIYFTNGLWNSIGLCALYKLALKIANPSVAAIALLFAALNPLVLFYGATGELYVYDLAFSSVFMLWVTSAKREHLRWVWLAFGIAGGFRLSSVVFLYPAMLAATWLRKEKLSTIIAHHLFGAMGMLLWLVPFIMHHGGISAIKPLMEDTASLPSTALQSAATYASAFVWMMHLAMPLLVLGIRRIKQLRRDHVIILAIWLILPTLFFVFKFYAKGYILLTLPVFAITIGLALDTITQRSRKIALVTVLGGGLACFFFVPLMPPSIPLERSNVMGDRIRTAGLRTLSWFAASNAHLRVRENMMKQAKDLIEAHVPVEGIVLADRAMPVWAHPRTLQFHVPNRVLLLSQGPLVSRLYQYEMTPDLEVLAALADTSYYICPNEIVALEPGIADLTLIERTETLSLYRASAATLASLYATMR